MELARLVSLALALAMLIPAPRSETNEVSIDLQAFSVGAIAFLAFMIMTCLMARQARLYGLLSTALVSAGLIGAVYVAMQYWELIR